MSTQAADLDAAVEAAADAVISLKTRDQVLHEIAEGLIPPEDAVDVVRALVRRMTRREIARDNRRSAAPLDSAEARD